MFSIIILAIAVSLDSFGVGVAYGLRGLKTPLSSLVVIGGCSGVLMGLAMLLGDLIGHTLSPQISSRLGGALLILIGIWQMVKAFRSSASDKKDEVILEGKAFGNSDKGLLRSCNGRSR
jgi:putative sporulation protein YtaF